MDSVFVALFGTSIFSAGVILQKIGSVWMVWNKKISRSVLYKFLIWLTGIIMSYVISAIFVGAASKNLSPQVVSAITAWNVVLIVILSYFFLKEKLYMTDIIYSIVIVCCVFFISSVPNNETIISINTESLSWLLFAPFVLLVPVFFKFTDKKKKTILLSIFSGFLGGLVLVFMNVLVKESGTSVENILKSPYLFVYFFSGIVSVAAKQFAYRIGDVVLITPLQTSFSMIYPILCSYFMFRSNISIIQVIMILLIVIACWKIQKKR